MDNDRLVTPELKTHGAPCWVRASVRAGPDENRFLQCSGDRTVPPQLLNSLWFWSGKRIDNIRAFMCLTVLRASYVFVIHKVSDKGFWSTSIRDPPPGASLHQAGPRQRCGTPTSVSCSHPGAARTGLQNQNQVSPFDLTLWNCTRNNTLQWQSWFFISCCLLQQMGTNWVVVILFLSSRGQGLIFLHSAMMMSPSNGHYSMWLKRS